MKIIRNFDDVSRDAASVITIGTFDGIHLAHQKIISVLTAIARNESRRSVLITFEPHPRKIVDSGYDLHILTSLKEKIEILNDFGVDILLVINFDEEFSKLNSLFFIKSLIYNKIGFEKIVLGSDHGFGNKRGGNIALLESLKGTMSFELNIIEPVVIGNQKVSSTAVRNALLNGEVNKANKYLGRPYSLEGKVIRGDERGRTIGFPTANLLPAHTNKLIPKNGVYFIQAVHENEKYFGFLNIGTRPTFTDSNSKFIESHLFDFNKNIYDQDIRINLLEYIREERKFESKENLIMQLEKDKEYCKNLVNKINHIN